jgi:hypothetical protein
VHEDNKDSALPAPDSTQIFGSTGHLLMMDLQKTNRMTHPKRDDATMIQLLVVILKLPDSSPMIPLPFHSCQGRRINEFSSAAVAHPCMDANRDANRDALFRTSAGAHRSQNRLAHQSYVWCHILSALSVYHILLSIQENHTIKPTYAYILISNERIHSEDSYWNTTI